jgi:chaperonin cofactor prefoldin
MGLIVYVLIIHIRAYRVDKKLEKRAARVDNDINTLHHNQSVLVSTLREINRELRKHEKSSKIFKRKLRGPFKAEEKDGE